jgi:hypothetical protein
LTRASVVLYSLAMNRRALLQSIGLAPFAVLGSPERLAQASTSERPERDSWNERRIVQLSMGVPTLDRSDFPVWNPGMVETSPFFLRLEQLVRAVTKTPDIMEPAYLTLVDKSGLRWGPTQEDLKTMPEWMTDVARLDVATLFRSGALQVKQAIQMQARNIVAMGMEPEPQPGWERVKVGPGMRRPVIGPMLRLTRALEKPGVFETVLSTLGWLHLDFFYYGPPPYPPGEVRTYDFEAKAWVPFRREIPPFHEIAPGDHVIKIAGSEPLW